MSRCPCLSGLPYESCCGRLHAGTVVAHTAEQLMRSRYSAFAVGDEAYLLATWHASTRPLTLGRAEERQWYRLDVLRTELGGPFDATGVVEFTAYHRSPAGKGSQHEVSRFVREDGRWFYLDGVR